MPAPRGDLDKPPFQNRDSGAVPVASEVFTRFPFVVANLNLFLMFQQPLMTQ